MGLCNPPIKTHCRWLEIRGTALIRVLSDENRDAECQQAIQIMTQMNPFHQQRASPDLHQITAWIATQTPSKLTIL
ncbi:uncharacterized protein LOC6042610 isoform X2 [Culex quinquefasciatus]|uniref:uncharacterized protein LOC6042610 isoform X2 n=1 Tax=Culex quinquefasciatus TaxID=7176 RepID=UPI0018E3205E|nr:uncharacterized protein LOC6042610 isoform X2 [Culex quinquefasciatus]